MCGPAAVNRADLLQRQGHYPPPPGAPAYPGLGVFRGDRRRSARRSPVGRSGSRSARCWPAAGTPSGWRCRPGSCCRCRPVSTRSTRPALPEVACTVWSNLVQVARLGAGETLLVHGGGSGIGTFAVQFGAALGATVLTDRPGDQARPAARVGRGAHRSTTREQDFVEEVRRVTDGRGADVDPRHHGCVLPGAERGGAGHRRPARGDRHAGRAQGRVGSRRAAGQAGQRRPRRRCASRPLAEKADDRPGRPRAGVAAGRGGPDPADRGPAAADARGRARRTGWSSRTTTSARCCSPARRTRAGRR